MSSRLYNILAESVNEFRIKAQTEISEIAYEIPSPTGNKLVNVTASQIESALNLICPLNIQALNLDFVKHFETLRGLIQFCSSPKSFRTAWDLRSESLNPWDANVLLNEGGQLIPLNNENRIFQCIQQGVELGINKRLVLAVRHSEGNYEDLLDDLGRFTYQPPNSTTGMLRYRWCQFLANKLPADFIFLAIMWFQIPHPLEGNLNHVFITAPVKIIDYENDLKNLGNSLHKPLQLQLINRSEVLSKLNIIFSLSETDVAIETRDTLPDQLAREWAYDKINNSSKGRNIKRWAQTTGKKCPGIMCKNGKNPHIEFRDLRSSDIAFGHIISQNWAKAFTYLLDRIDHPDNLYLTCKSCNSSLGDKFPDDSLKAEILRTGTIGDWLRTNEKEIRKA